MTLAILHWYNSTKHT